MPENRPLIFIDSGVLIAAAQGGTRISDKALRELDRNDVDFASSHFVKLEVLPLARHNRRQPEVDFYNEFFKAVKYWAKLETELAERALEEGAAAGLGAVDALHIASALQLGATEIVTTEKGSKPFARVKTIRVRTLA